MSSPTMEAIRLKTKRAEDHLNDFKAHYLGQRDPVFPPNPVGIHLHDDRKGITVDTMALKPAQQRWLGVLLGDVIHQARASLDHIVYALALASATRSGRVLLDKEIRKLLFVIAKDSNNFTSHPRNNGGWLERMIGSKEFTVLESMQPYNRNPVAPESDPLWLLSELDNIDKHRTFVVIQNNVRVVADLEMMSGEKISQSINIATATQPMNPHAQIFSVDFTTPNPIAAVGVDSTPTRHIFYAEAAVPGCVGIEVFSLTRTMICVADEIIAKFERFL